MWLPLSHVEHVGSSVGVIGQVSHRFHPCADLERSSKGGISLSTGSHQEGQDASGGQTIVEEEARSDVKAAKTTRSLLAVLPKDDRGRTWSQAVRGKEKFFPITRFNELLNKAANQHGRKRHGRKTLQRQ